MAAVHHRVDEAVAVRRRGDGVAVGRRRGDAAAVVAGLDVLVHLVAWAGVRRRAGARAVDHLAEAAVAEVRGCRGKNGPAAAAMARHKAAAMAADSPVAGAAAAHNNNCNIATGSNTT